MINASTKSNLRIFSAGVALSGCVIVIGHFLRQLGLTFNPVLWSSTAIIAALLGFTIAANILVRYHGTGDRFSLFLGAAFGLDGLIQLSGIVKLHGKSLSADNTMRVPLFWMAGGTLLGVLLLAAIGLDKWLPWPREFKRTIFAVLSVAAAIAGMTGILFIVVSRGPLIREAKLLTRPWDLLQAALFGSATMLFHHNHYRLTSPLWLLFPLCSCLSARSH